MPGSSSHNRTYFHTLCHVVRMIDFFYISGGKSYLVSVGAISLCSIPYKLLLRKLAFNGFTPWHRRITCPCNSHGLVHICSSRKRISYGSTETSCSPAKGFYFRGVIVGFIFKINEPFLILAVHIHRNHYGACIYLLRFFLILKLSLCLKLFCGKKGHIHKADVLVTSAFI